MYNNKRKTMITIFTKKFTTNKIQLINFLCSVLNVRAVKERKS